MNKLNDPKREADSVTEMLDNRAVMDLLPHRYPFLLVDRITHSQPGSKIVGLKNVSRGDPLLAVSNTNLHAMPHLLVIEALAQVSVILALRTLNFNDDQRPMFFFAGIDDAAFGRVAVQGDVVELESAIVRIMPERGVGKFRGRAHVGSNLVAEATLIAAIRSRN